MASVLEQPVQVGESRFIHVRSAVDPSRTRCGLMNTLQTFFVNTDREVTCTTCKAPQPVRRSA